MTRVRFFRLNKVFNGTQALRDASGEFPDHGIIAIVGPNGAGKTTLINVLTGYIRPDSGQSFLGNREITHLAPYRIAKMGVARTFQDLRLALQLSVIDNVLLACPEQRGEKLLFVLLPFGVKREEEKNAEEARRWLRFVGLEKDERRLAGELSYGQQKLLTMACCMAANAQVLYLDEPIAGVHPSVALRILELLETLRQQGKLVIFIEHDISAVRRIADIVFVMDQGKVIAEGPPQEVLDRPEILEAYLA